MCYKVDVEAKNDVHSDHYRKEGNREYTANVSNERLMVALWHYNMALCFAETKPKLALAYANRSIVYLKLKKYDECLMNIQWARENEYPADKMHKLDEREQECIEAKKNKVYDAEEDPWNYFKLSHPANPKIPFIVDCLEYRPENGGGIYTTRDLNAGDFIAIETAAYLFMHYSSQYTRCCYCMKTVMSNCIPCLKCASVMYCSEECRNKTYESVDDLIGVIKIDEMLFNFKMALAYADETFGGRKNLKRFVKRYDIKIMKKTVFDFDFSGNPESAEYKKNMLMCMMSFQTSFKSNVQALVNHEPTHHAKDPATRKFLEHFSSVFLRNQTHNINIITGYGLVFEGLFFFPFYRLFNHACNNNIGSLLVDNRMMLYAAVPIKAGQQLFVDLVGFCAGVYNKTQEGRRNILKHYENIDCECLFCVNNNITSNATDLDDFKPDTTVSRSIKVAFEEIRKNWKLISEVSGDPYRVEKLRARNQKLLSNAAVLLAFPCIPDDTYA